MQLRGIGTVELIWLRTQPPEDRLEGGVFTCARNTVPPRRRSLPAERHPLAKHVLRVLTTDGQVLKIAGERNELVGLRNRLLFAIGHDRHAIIRHALSTGNVEIRVEDVAAAGNVEPVTAGDS